MAEFVQLRKEKWTEPLNMLQQLGLLTAEEFRYIVVNLDNFEHKIQSQSRKLEDILMFIQFESSLLIKIKERRKSLEDKYNLSQEIDRFIYNEILSQFGSAEITFLHDINFWNAKLKFIANIVPDQDKEAEFNRLFKKVINYCGGSDLNIYKTSVDYLWSFAKKPTLAAKGKRRRRRDVSKLMENIRYFTHQAIRNFPKNSEASIWFLTTELKYLQLLREEEENYKEEYPTKVRIPYNIEDEVDKSEQLVNVIYNNLVKECSEMPLVYIQLYDAVRLFPVSEARMISKKAYAQVMSLKNRPLEVLDWILGRSIDDNKTDEFIERINQAFSSPHSKVKILEMCIEKMNCFLEKLKNDTSDPENQLPRFLVFYTNFIHKDNSEWNQVPSEVLHASRIQIIKDLPKLIERLVQNCEETKSLQSFQSDHNLEKTVKHFVKQFPSSFILVKERILHLLSQKDEDKLKPKVICKHLSEVNWKLSQNDDGLKLLNFVYYAFLTLKKFSKENKINLFLKLSPNSIPEMNGIRVMHLKKMYIEDAQSGRDFYMQFRQLTSDWRFACETIKIETVMCRNGEGCSKVLQFAYEDAVRLGGTSSTEPWKICIESKNELKNVKEASNLLKRSLGMFNKHNNAAGHEELVKFSRKCSSVV